MKLAIMQPYLFPYVGYFQLLTAVDKFIVYDDVNFIKQGWINRNNILLNGKRYLFTVPLEDAASFKAIKDTSISAKLYENWNKKFEKTLEAAYKKAPYFNDIFPVIKQVFTNVPDDRSIAGMALNSILAIKNYLGITTLIEPSSSVFSNQHLKGAERLVDICKTEKALTYINPIGGQELYEKEYFKADGIELFFLQTDLIEYQQFTSNHIANLSFIDVLMFNSKESCLRLLSAYKLI